MTLNLVCIQSFLFFSALRINPVYLLTGKLALSFLFPGSKFLVCTALAVFLGISLWDTSSQGNVP
jgi:hypothetical protein